MKEQIEKLLKEWHEAGRAEFTNRYSSLTYDDIAYQKKAVEKRKYICLDVGTSGAFLVDKTTGEIWGIKAYGVPHHGKFIGKLGEVTGKTLHERRWWNLKYA